MNVDITLTSMTKTKIHTTIVSRVKRTLKLSTYKYNSAAEMLSNINFPGCCENDCLVLVVEFKSEFINALICPTSIEQSASPYVVHGQRSVRWITSLASGSSCWGPNEVAGRGPRHTPPPSPQVALKWCATQRPRLSPFMSVTARRSEDTCDDIVVSAYEED